MIFFSGWHDEISVVVLGSMLGPQFKKYDWTEGMVAKVVIDKKTEEHIE